MIRWRTLAVGRGAPDLQSLLLPELTGQELNELTFDLCNERSSDPNPGGLVR
jgi:hypothetical protein